MPVLPTHPPDFVPGFRYMQERYEKLKLNPDGFLWPEEEKLVHHLRKSRKNAYRGLERKKESFGKISFPQSAS
jgi:hypothetical protein